MTAISQWDAEFLNERDDSARQAALNRQFDDDWQEAIRQVAREAADVARVFERCARAGCRRARRCMGDADGCLKAEGASLPPEVEQALIEQVYAEIQEDRCATAKEAEAE